MTKCDTIQRNLGLIAVGWLVGMNAFSSDALAEWRAGVARRDITPQKQIWMSGYAGRRSPAEGKLTDLWAKCVVLEDSSGHRAAAVTLDLVGIDRGTASEICRKLEQSHGLKRDQVALLCSHTHTGPVVGRNLGPIYALSADQWKDIDEWTAKLIQDVVEVVGEAVTDLAPAKVSWAVGEANFAVNRRTNREADVPQLRQRGELQGPTDHDVPVLTVSAPDGRLRAVLFGYACHATVLSLNQWSGDYPGYAQIELEKSHPGAVALFWAGCGADQNPLPRRTVELAQEYGRKLSDAVDAVLSGEMQSIGGTLTTQYDEIDLALGALPSRENIEAQAASGNQYEVRRAQLLLAKIERSGRLSPTYPYPVQTWQLGGGPQWVILGGEVVVDYSLRIKRELGADRTWVAGYANDVMAYIPSLRVLREGGYEGGGSMVYYGLPAAWSENVEEHIIRTVQKQAAQNLPRKTSERLPSQSSPRP